MREVNSDPSTEDKDFERLVLQALRDGLDPQDAARLDALAAGDPIRARRLAELAETWTLAGLVSPGSGRDRLAQTVMSRRVMVAGGVGGALAASIAGWWLLGPSTRLYQAPDSGPLRARLADGSAVVLSRGGRLEVRMDGAHRAVQMVSGIALWTVSHDRHRPFEVSVAGHRLVVLGTRFNVDPDPAGLRVDLLEGSLRVEPAGGEAPVVLKPGEYYDSGHVPRVGTADGESIAAWTEGRLVFDDVTLGEVAVKVRRHSGRQFHFTDPALARLRFSGVLNLNDADHWKPGLEAVLPVRMEAVADGFKIASR
jgi:transmembrane sensor